MGWKADAPPQVCEEVGPVELHLKRRSACIVRPSQCRNVNCNSFGCLRGVFLISFHVEEAGVFVAVLQCVDQGNS